MHGPDFPPAGPTPARLTAAKLLRMFLLVLGVKFWVLRVGSAPLPIFDQWEAEGQRLLQPWLHGQFRVRALFAPWIQHRIGWTRLLVLGGLQANGQWDTQVEAITAEWVRAGTALLLGDLLIRRLGRRWEDAVLLGLLLLFALANTISGGFASQQYVLLFFAVVTIWGLCSHRPGSAGWLLGVAGDAFIALVDERSGATTWLLPGPVRDGWQSILIKTPAGPFHVEAVLAPGSNHRLAFLFPREVGRWSAWMDPLLDSATRWLGAGAVRWLGALFWHRLGLGALGKIRLRLPPLTRRRRLVAPREAVCVP